tara:strand:- start:2503 stop:3078 length:576 start_codon:yes stop_codon:yes gene_type:complete
MAIDVLTYNALQEVNQELRQELTDLTAQVTEASSGGGGGGSTIALSDACNVLRKVAEAGYMHQANQWCLFPTTYGSDANVFCPNSGTAFTSGFKVCDTSGYYRCGNHVLGLFLQEQLVLDSKFGVLVEVTPNLDAVGLLLMDLLVLMLLLLFQFLLVVNIHYVLVVLIVAMLMVMDIINREDMILMFRELT